MTGAYNLKKYIALKARQLPDPYGRARARVRVCAPTGSASTRIYIYRYLVHALEQPPIYRVLDKGRARGRLHRQDYIVLLTCMHAHFEKIDPLGIAHRARPAGHLYS